VKKIIKEWRIKRIRRKQIGENYGSEQIKYNFITMKRESILHAGK